MIIGVVVVGITIVIMTTIISTLLACHCSPVFLLNGLMVSSLPAPMQAGPGRIFMEWASSSPVLPEVSWVIHASGVVPWGVGLRGQPHP